MPNRRLSRWMRARTCLLTACALGPASCTNPLRYLPSGSCNGSESGAVMLTARDSINRPLADLWPSDADAVVEVGDTVYVSGLRRMECFGGSLYGMSSIPLTITIDSTRIALVLPGISRPEYHAKALTLDTGWTTLRATYRDVAGAPPAVTRGLVVRPAMRSLSLEISDTTVHVRDTLWVRLRGFDGNGVGVRPDVRLLALGSGTFGFGARGNLAGVLIAADSAGGLTLTLGFVAWTAGVMEFRITSAHANTASLTMRAVP